MDPMRSRWTKEQVAQWHEESGWVFGCNFTPSTAGNQLEFWSEATFDSEVIDRELGFAARIGMNTVRVFLHHLLWEHETTAFLERFDLFLRIADAHGIRAMPVLFDGVWNPNPVWGPQPDPTPGVHNSIWVQSPGGEVLHDESRWPSLVPYLENVMSAFAKDPRVLAWDLFNEADQIDLNTIVAGSRDHKARAAARLLAEVIQWARGVNVSQPLTVGLWEYDDGVPASTPINELILGESDVVTFHCYLPADGLQRVIDDLGRHGRPMVCTEWLGRGDGSTADLIELFAAADVGAINWGLVSGRTQTRYPWKTWWEPVDNDEPWFHELLHPDGAAYDDAEIGLLRQTAQRMAGPA